MEVRTISTKVLLNYNKEEIEKLLIEFKEYIKDYKFKIAKRDKNDATIYKFNLNKSKIRNLLLELRSNDYILSSTEENYEKNGPGQIHIYKKEFTLINIFGEEEKVTIYIKYKYMDNFTKIPIISFHEDE